MPTNPYFGELKITMEQWLLDDLNKEAIEIHGQDMFYIPRDVIEKDELFLEEIETRFKECYLIDMYIQNVDGFEGQGDILSKFGFQMVDQATLIVSRTKFDRIVPNLERPREGDLIYFPLTQGLFEINFVEREDKFYQLGKKYTWRLEVELFKYNNETFETGLDVVDDNVTEMLENNDDLSNSKYSRNDEIETEGDAVIDFTEDNPFGDY